MPEVTEEESLQHHGQHEHGDRRRLRTEEADQRSGEHRPDDEPELVDGALVAQRLRHQARRPELLDQMGPVAAGHRADLRVRGTDEARADQQLRAGRPRRQVPEEVDLAQHRQCGGGGQHPQGTETVHEATEDGSTDGGPQADACDDQPAHRQTAAAGRQDHQVAELQHRGRDAPQEGGDQEGPSTGLDEARIAGWGAGAEHLGSGRHGLSRAWSGDAPRPHTRQKSPVWFTSYAEGG